jgi:DNA helicase-2/ATP-dependent DNA helicase PcrA
MTNAENIEAEIFGNATDDQKRAIRHRGTHARLLAGPGTGKTQTLTQKVLYLVLVHNVTPENILLVTFTRLAASQLKEKIKRVLDPHAKSLPHISTLHSFALRQILHNSSRVDTLPKPLRIADDWEERNIIEEDLKAILHLPTIKDVRKLINQLSADWGTLNVDVAGWEQGFPSPAFLGAWEQHREIFGETLRAELVYQLKRQLNQNRNFVLSGEYKYVLIDEFQDFNPCDLAIVRELANSRAEIFVVGDDDQSIYGFRFADPSGIRQFPTTYPNTKELALEICHRCDRDVLRAAEFVANLDPRRLQKPTRPSDNAESGEVFLVNCPTQDEEVQFIANKIEELISQGIERKEIVVLLRNDKNGKFSKPVMEALTAKNIEAAQATESEIDNNEHYRKALSVLRIIVDPDDHLAYRTLLQLTKGIGEQTVNALLQCAITKRIKFTLLLREIKSNPSEYAPFGSKIVNFLTRLEAKIEEYKKIEDFPFLLAAVIEREIEDVEDRVKITSYFDTFIIQTNAGSLAELLKSISISSEEMEQETVPDAVNILTMHQAKGLTFNVCFILGVEDETLPGINEGAKEDDERRLLYVSMTRARHKLFMTYCAKRTGLQRHSGRNSGREQRTLTRFLRNSPLHVTRI